MSLLPLKESEWRYYVNCGSHENYEHNYCGSYANYEIHGPSPSYANCGSYAMYVIDDMTQNCGSYANCEIDENYVTYVPQKPPYS